jgi:hypothetical protein
MMRLTIHPAEGSKPPLISLKVEISGEGKQLVCGLEPSMMGQKKTIVSVCIPTYNRSEFLKGAIESVLAWTFEDFELIICDNASEDETEAMVREYNDSRIIYSRNTRNIGLRRNWKRFLLLARFSAKGHG